MQRANVLLSLAGDVGNTIPKFNVSAAEIAVLRAIHGPESVNEVERVEDSKISQGDELRRLRELYPAEDGAKNRVVDKVFAGSTLVIEKLDQLDPPLADNAWKPTSTAKGDKPKKAIEAPAGTGSARDEDGIGDMMK